MVSEGMERVIKLLREFQASTEKPSVKATRAGLDQMANMTRLPKDVKCTPIDAGGVPAEWITTPNINQNNVILYLHGGGFIAGSIKTHRDLASRISRAANARILIIEYRLAPEYPFPAALYDSITAYQWLHSTENINSKNIIIAGDSAGGGLTLSSLVKLRDEGQPLPIAAVCISPATDLAGTGDSIKTKAKLDPFITPEAGEFMTKMYLGNGDPKYYLASPLYADLQGLPPLFVQVGTSEILLDDSVRLAERAKAAGVDVELDVWEDMIHVFAAFAAFAPESKQAIEKIGAFVQKFFK